MTQTTGNRYEIVKHKHSWAIGKKVVITGYNEKTKKITCVCENLPTQKFELRKENLKICA